MVWDRTRVNRITEHADYQNYLKRIEEFETDREFCGHTMVHFLEVARVAELINLTEQKGVPEELVYGAALVHDIGRFEEYLNGIPHEQASARLAEPILADCGFSEEERAVILEAVLRHRDKASAEAEGLVGLIYRGDKGSRNCFECGVVERCRREGEK